CARFGLRNPKRRCGVSRDLLACARGDRSPTSAPKERGPRSGTTAGVRARVAANSPAEAAQNLDPRYHVEPPVDFRSVFGAVAAEHVVGARAAVERVVAAVAVQGVVAAAAVELVVLGPAVQLVVAVAAVEDRDKGGGGRGDAAGSGEAVVAAHAVERDRPRR